MMFFSNDLKSFSLSFIIAGIFSFVSCAEHTAQISNMNEDLDTVTIDTATFGTGCFWCTEAIFERLKGVIKVTSGYGGGPVPDPTYEEVSTGTTGHAECCQVLYDPSKISFDELLEVFWKTHDPTTLNRQGNDVGTQYRSVVFYHSPEQKQKAEQYKAALDTSGAFSKPIVTTIEPYKNFYSAEDYHQKYYEYNGEQMYCRLVIAPKVDKFEKVFKNRLKSSAKTQE